MIRTEALLKAKPNVADFGRIAVLLGGRSGEREVSLQSGAAVIKALQAAGADVVAIDLYASGANPVEQLLAQPIDTVFNMLHGGEGENGVIAGLLESLDLPYTGSGVAASALAMNKLQCKYLWRGMGLPTADFELLHADSDWAQIIARLGLPLMVKPAGGGSSIGMSKVERAEQLPAAYALAAPQDSLVIAEPWLAGREYTVAILRGLALPAIALVTKRAFYDYQAKYIDDDTQYLVPCGLPAAEEQALQQLALQAFDSLGCGGWGRVDLMQDGQGRTQLLEVNTVPGMTSHSLVPMAAKALGLSFDQLVLQILSTARSTTGARGTSANERQN